MAFFADFSLIGLVLSGCLTRQLSGVALIIRGSAGPSKLIFGRRKSPFAILQLSFEVSRVFP
jgi:hypothetical protein